MLIILTHPTISEIRSVITKRMLIYIIKRLFTYRCVAINFFVGINSNQYGSGVSLKIEKEGKKNNNYCLAS